MDKLTSAAEKQAKSLVHEVPLKVTFELNHTLQELKKDREKRTNTVVNQFQNVEIPATFL
jgi:hypothetical protein